MGPNINSLLKLWGIWLGLSAVLGLVLTPFSTLVYDVFIPKQIRGNALHEMILAFKPLMALGSILIVLLIHTFWRVRQVSLVLILFAFICASYLFDTFVGVVHLPGPRLAFSQAFEVRIPLLLLSLGGIIVGALIYMIWNLITGPGKALSRGEQSVFSSFFSIEAKSGLSGRFWGQAFIAICTFSAATALSGLLRLPATWVLARGEEERLTLFGGTTDIVLFAAKLSVTLVVPLVALLVAVRWQVRNFGPVRWWAICAASGVSVLTTVLLLVQSAVVASKAYDRDVELGAYLGWMTVTPTFYLGAVMLPLAMWGMQFLFSANEATQPTPTDEAMR